MPNPLSSKPRYVGAACLVTVAATLGLSACGPDNSGSDKPAAPATAAASPAAPTATVPAPAATPSAPGKAPTAAAPGRTTPAAPVPPVATGADCTVDDLRITAQDNTIDTKEGVVTVQMHNKGSRECRVNGFPGVDLKVSGGSISVPRKAEQAVSGQIPPGGDAAFNIYFQVNTTGGTGVKPTQIVVTPPNDTHQVTLAWPGGSFPVDNPDHPNSGTKLEVGPAGKVG
ncbi:DUF4232 domain-containing protein [Kitasatospora sp. SUK 42]|uniref:DUF4232 domain-containing protein n=1 Tax=Kitasatospora sp. SUK 42 TaxID=1588882 RepID=UPI001C312337|nr:DUF4232 domain-containing protein [Kitasatospora sp. SUK 42]MBV2153090.1 DUF4232 domain-containing protein [Kitasatospora sp. SUK 42]